MKTMKTMAAAKFCALKEQVKNNCSSIVLKEEKLDILMLQGSICFKHEEKQKVLSRGQKAPSAKATERVAKLLGRKKDLVADVWRSYVNGIPLSVANPAGNYQLKSTQVPRPHGVVNRVQLFVREQRHVQ